MVLLRKEQLSVLRAYWSRTQFSATGGSSSTNIPEATLNAASITGTDGGNATSATPVRGIITSGTANLVKLREEDDGYALLDSSDRVIFGRITFAAGNYTISYVALSGASEVSTSIPDNVDIDMLFPEVMNFEEIPADAPVLDEAGFILSGVGGAGGGGAGEPLIQEQETLTVGIDGQTAFTLSQTPLDSTAVEMFVNGQKQEHGIDYTVSGTSVTYSYTSPDPRELLTTDVVEFWYIVSGSGGGGGGLTQTLAQTLQFGNITDGYDIEISDGDDIRAPDGYLDLNVLSTGANPELIRFQKDGTSFLEFDPSASVNMNLSDDAGNFALKYASAQPTTNTVGSTISFTGQQGNGTGDGGQATLIGGVGGDTGGGGAAGILGGAGGASGGSGGPIQIIGGDAVFGLNDGGPITFQPGAGIGGGNDGYINILGAGSTIIFDELSDHSIAPAAAKGMLWVRDDSPNVLVFTDDAGTDTVLGSGGGGGGSQTLAETLDNGNTTDGYDISMTDGDVIVAPDGHITLNALSTGLNTAAVNFQEDGVTYTQWVEQTAQAEDPGFQAVGDGVDISIEASEATGTNSFGGSLSLYAGRGDIGGSGGGAGALATFEGGTGGSVSRGGGISLTTGSGSSAGRGGHFTFQAGAAGASATGSNSVGGNFTFTGGNSRDSGEGGGFTFTGGNGASNDTGDGGSFSVTGGNASIITATSTFPSGATLDINGGVYNASNQTGGSAEIRGGDLGGTGDGTAGSVVLSTGSIASATGTKVAGSISFDLLDSNSDTTGTINFQEDGTTLAYWQASHPTFSAQFLKGADGTGSSNGTVFNIGGGDGGPSGGDGADVNIVGGLAVAAGTAGGDVSINGAPGASSGGGNGGTVGLNGGVGTSGSGNGGTTNIIAGDASGTGSGGFVTISSGDSTSGAAGDISITAGDGGTSGGDISLTGGDNNGSGVGGGIGITSGSPTNGAGGSISLLTTVGTGSNAGGVINITAAAGGSSNGAGGAINITTGAGNGSTATGGLLTLKAGGGSGSNTGDGGAVSILGGDGGNTGTTTGGDITVTPGDGGITGGAGGALNLNGGDGTGGTSAGGNVNITPGSPSGVTDPGVLNLLGSGATLVFDELSDHSIEFATAKGMLWVRDDSPNVLVFTDDAGTDTVLGSGGGGGGSQTLAETLDNGNTADGYDIDLNSGSTLISSDGNVTVNDNLDVFGDGYFDGKLTVTGLIDPTGMVYDEQSSVPGGTPATNKSTMWIRDTDGYIVVTDDLGQDHVYMPGAGGGGGASSLDNTLALGNFTGGFDIDFTSGDAANFLGEIDVQRQGTTILSTSGSDAPILAGLTYPVTDGTDGQVLTTDGAGNLTFTDVTIGNSLDGYTVDATFTTTDDTPATVDLFSDFGDESSAQMELKVFAEDGTDGYFGVWKIIGNFKKTGGVVEKMDEAGIIIESRDDTSWTIDLETDGTALQIEATGDAVNEVEWRVVGTIQVSEGPAVIPGGTLPGSAFASISGVAGRESTDGYAGYTAIGGFVFDPDSLPSSATITFQTLLETSDGYNAAQIRLFNVTTASVVSNSILSSTSEVPEAVEVVLASPDDLAAGENEYEVQLKFENEPSTGDQATCKFAHLLIEGLGASGGGGGSGGGGASTVAVTSTPTTLDDPGFAHTVALVNVAGAATVNLPASPTTNATITVKDAGGMATSDNITVDGNGNTIDGALTYIIAIDDGAVTMIFDGTEWFIY